MQPRTCETCAAWVRSDDQADQGVCHLTPPTVLLAGFQQPPAPIVGLPQRPPQPVCFNTRPTMNAADFCMMWQAGETPASQMPRARPEDMDEWNAMLAVHAASGTETATARHLEAQSKLRAEGMYHGLDRHPGSDTFTAPSKPQPTE